MLQPDPVYELKSKTSEPVHSLNFFNQQLQVGKRGSVSVYCLSVSRVLLLHCFHTTFLRVILKMPILPFLVASFQLWTESEHKSDYFHCEHFRQSLYARPLWHGENLGSRKDGICFEARDRYRAPGLRSCEIHCRRKLTSRPQLFIRHIRNWSHRGLYNSVP